MDSPAVWAAGRASSHTLKGHCSRIWVKQGALRNEGLPVHCPPKSRTLQTGGHSQSRKLGNRLGRRRRTHRFMGISGNPEPEALGVLAVGFEVFEPGHEKLKLQFEHELLDTQPRRTEGYGNPSVEWQLAFGFAWVQKKYDHRAQQQTCWRRSSQDHSSLCIPSPCIEAFRQSVRDSQISSSVAFPSDPIILAEAHPKALPCTSMSVGKSQNF